MKNKFISKSGGVISDILEISNTLALEGFLFTKDTEKVFDTANHCFLLHILQKFGFGIDSVSWIKTIFKNRQSCIINEGKTTKYFKLERGARQGDIISAYLSKVCKSFDVNFYTPLTQMILLSFSNIDNL